MKLILAMSFYKKEKGFTIVELMVVLAILVALTALVLAGYSESFPRLAVERSAEAFINDVYRVRERAFSALSYDENIKDASHGIFIEEEAESYELFLEGHEAVEVVDIDRGARVDRLYLEEERVGELKIVFDRNEEKVLFGDSEGVSEKEEARVYFVSQRDEDLVRGVSINSKGVAEIRYE